MSDVSHQQGIASLNDRQPISGMPGSDWMTRSKDGFSPTGSGSGFGGSATSFGRHMNGGIKSHHTSDNHMQLRSANITETSDTATLQNIQYSRAEILALWSSKYTSECPPSLKVHPDIVATTPRTPKGLDHIDPEESRIFAGSVNSDHRRRGNQSTQDGSDIYGSDKYSRGLGSRRGNDYERQPFSRGNMGMVNVGGSNGDSVYSSPSGHNRERSFGSGAGSSQTTSALSRRRGERDATATGLMESRRTLLSPKTPVFATSGGFDGVMSRTKPVVNDWQQRKLREEPWTSKSRRQESEHEAHVEPIRESHAQQPTETTENKLDSSISSLQNSASDSATDVLSEDPYKDHQASEISGVDRKVPSMPPGLSPLASLTGTLSPANQWHYKDPTGTIQGPFSSLEMNTWFAVGYFMQDMPIRNEYDHPVTGFSALYNLVSTSIDPAKPFDNVYRKPQILQANLDSSITDSSHTAEHIEQTDVPSLASQLAEQPSTAWQAPDLHSSSQVMLPDTTDAIAQQTSSQELRSEQSQSAVTSGETFTFEPASHDTAESELSATLEEQVKITESSPIVDTLSKDTANSKISFYDSPTAILNRSVNKQKKSQTKPSLKLSNALTQSNDTESALRGSEDMNHSTINLLPTPKVAPWADAKIDAGFPSPSLLQIQQAETLKARQELEEKRLQSASRPELKTELSEGLPPAATWAAGSPQAVSASTSAWQKPTGGKKTMKQIQAEEEAAAAARARAAASKRPEGNPIVKGYASSLTNSSSSNATATASGWTTVGSAKGQKVLSPAVIPSRTPIAANYPVNSVSVPSKPAQSSVAVAKPEITGDWSAEMLSWCKTSLEGGLTGVDVNEFVQMLLSFPPDLEVIQDMVNASSTTLDGRRFAFEFLKRRKLDAQARSAGSTVSLAALVAATPSSNKVVDNSFKVVKRKGQK